jgi:hypothetical protein
MEWLFDVMQMALILGSVAVAPIGISWALVGRDGFSLAELFRLPTNPPWPRGVQEDEPVRWRPELLDRRRSAQVATEGSPRTAGVRVRLTTDAGR